MHTHSYKPTDTAANEDWRAGMQATTQVFGREAQGATLIAQYGQRAQALRARLTPRWV
jgi:ABC-type Fe3+-hydroxamate transport system substrate-binding protein